MTPPTQPLSRREALQLKPVRTLRLAQAGGIRTMFYASAVFLAVIAGVGYFFLPQATHETSGATT